MLAFFTSPARGPIILATALLIVAMLLLARGRVASSPPALIAGEPSDELGSESPAIANLLTNGFVVAPPAAVATLLDLVARGWLRVEHAETEVVLLTDRRGREGDTLTRYEQQVLNHVHRLTAGTLTGVSGAGVEVAGLRLPRRWWRRFTAAVVADAHRKGLSVRRWDVLAVGPSIVAIAGAGRAWWSAVRNGDQEAVVDSLAPRAIAAVVGVAILLVGIRLVRLLRSRAQRPTEVGAERARHWLAVRAWMEPRGFEGASSVAANSASRALAYAAAMGLAERAADELPIVPEDDRLGWSNATGEWRTVRVRYPWFRPGYGRHPAVVLAVGVGGGIAVLALQRFLLRVARQEALTDLMADFPDQAELIERIALVVAALLVAPLLWLGWMAIAGALDLFATLERQGVIVRARRPQRVVPFPRLLRPLARRDRFSLFIAIDDGRHDRVTAWLATERTAVPQGARARVRATPVLGYVRSSEPIGATRPVTTAIDRVEH